MCSGGNISDMFLSPGSSFVAGSMYPGGRSEMNCWTDVLSPNVVWVFGGTDSSAALLDELWNYDIL